MKLVQRRRQHMARLAMLSLLLLLIPLVSTTLIPRDLLFSDPKYSAVSLSHDGRFFAYIAPDDVGVKNVFTKCVSCKSTRQVTFETESDVLSYTWTGVSDIILYTQDNDGDENTIIYKKNISQAAIHASRMDRSIGMGRVEVSNRPGVKAIIMANNHKDSRVLIGLNDEIPAFHNIYSFDLITNQMTLVFRNSRFPMLVIDHDLEIRLASEEQADGTIVYFRPTNSAADRVESSGTGEWAEYLRVSPDDKPTTVPVSFDKENKNMYWLWGKDSDLGTLVTFPFDAPEKQEVLYTATKAQIGNILFHPEDKTLLAVTEIYHKPELLVANNTVMEDLQYLVNLRPHASLQILSLSRDMNTWLVTYLSADQPFEVFLYRKWIKTAELLFNTHPQLEGYTLNKQIGFDFRTRDNMVLQAYLSLPPKARLMSSKDVSVGDKGYADLGMIPTRPQKMILMVHGGPKARDGYGFSPMNAWLTSRGYAVLQVNFRGSVGFGKSLTNAGNGEWGRKMHYDLLDAVEFAVAKGIANRSEVAIMGGSYGGYASLVGLTFTPDVFACGIDIVGPSNLVSLLEAVPPYWLGFYQDLVKMVGADIKTEEGRQSLISRSPLFFADRVKKPIMILQGANDPRVKQKESDQFVAALKKNSIPVTYVLYPDEGHGFRKANNRLAQSGYMEHFLNSCLGGEYEAFFPGQYNSTALLKSDGYAPSSTSTTSTSPPTTTTRLSLSTPKPTLAPQMFYRPAFNRFPAQQQVRPTVYMRPTNNVMTRIFPQHG